MDITEYIEAFRLAIRNLNSQIGVTIRKVSELETGLQSDMVLVDRLVSEPQTKSIDIKVKNKSLAELAQLAEEYGCYSHEFINPGYSRDTIVLRLYIHLTDEEIGDKLEKKFADIADRHQQIDQLIADRATMNDKVRILKASLGKLSRQSNLNYPYKGNTDV